MLTFFTTGKPFREHSGVIQRNALNSWKMLHPDVEIILFGDDAGAAEIARELGLRHEPFVERDEKGNKRLDYMFGKAQEIARHELLCYVNGDILLPGEFCGALQRVASTHENFLMVGRRWDTDITQAIDFGRAVAWAELKHLVQTQGVQRGPDAVDYFAFRRGFYNDVPPLVVGRVWWDHWLVWKAIDQGGQVVDATKSVMAIHQNHNYGYHPAGASGVWTDKQAKRNYELAGGRWRLHTIADATRVLREKGEEKRYFPRWFAPYWRYLRPKVMPVWFAVLGVTRPVRNLLGLREKASIPKTGEAKS